MASYGTVASNFPWLIQPNPGEYALAARRNAIASQANFLRGVQLRQNQQQIDMQKQQAADEKTRLDTAAKMQGALAADLSKLRTPESVLGYFAENPAAFTNPYTKDAATSALKAASDMYSIQTGSTEAKLQQERVKNVLELQENGYLDEGVDPRSVGPDVLKEARVRQAADMFRQRGAELGVDVAEFEVPVRPNGSYDQGKAEQMLLSKTPFEPSGTLGKDLTDIAEMRKRGMEREADLAQEALNVKIAPRGMVVEFDDLNRPIIRTNVPTNSNSGLGDTTVATRSRLQQDLVKSEVAIGILNELEKNLTQANLGVQGFLGEVVVDQGLAQMMPELASESRVTGRTLLRFARENLLKQVSTDNRFSNIDREFISRVLPEEGVMESLPRARAKLEIVRDMFRERAQTFAEGLGTQPLFLMTPEEIRGKFEAGELTEEEATNALLKYHGR